MSNHFAGAVPFSIPKPPPAPKIRENQTTTNIAAPQSSVTFVYQTKVAESRRSVTVTWSKNLVSHSFCLTVENSSEENNFTCKIDFKAWQFWGKKGLKSFEIDRRRVDVFWDFRQAKFDTTPMPCSDYYVVLVCRQEIVLLLGDLKEEAYKRTRSKPLLEEAALLYKKENVCGKKVFSTKAVLDESPTEHDIVIETSLSGPGDPEMWIIINGTTAIRIMNLNWRFRGNETVTVNGLPVQIFWDVHDWLFSSPGASHGLFIFKPGNSLEFTSHSDPDDNNQHKETPSREFCHFLHAWKEN
ncbi:DUF868 family protein (DUF868) [Quillaja saponaria]|uniref:DUF868 family protein (DUF868) n=1 Tax=Quillaja saponaria TaxID=32244 RepID=A0AAD7LSY1_QUISA|nr:DUF868 family protein (DUF868) [Quillaja saponaria]